jgi:hypothetical protein
MQNASVATSEVAETEGHRIAATMQLLSAHGPIIGGAALTAILGFPSQEAFRKAASRNTLPVPTFKLEHRRGRYAYTADVARWLASLQGERRRVVMK